jgi:hypothetical protein
MASSRWMMIGGLSAFAALLPAIGETLTWAGGDDCYFVKPAEHQPTNKYYYCYYRYYHLCPLYNVDVLSG